MDLQGEQGEGGRKWQREFMCCMCAMCAVACLGVMWGCLLSKQAISPAHRPISAQPALLTCTPAGWMSEMALAAPSVAPLPPMSNCGTQWGGGGQRAVS